MQIDVEIDKLTNSIEERVSKKRFDTEVLRMLSTNAGQLNGKDWLFDWQQEIRDTQRQVFKLTRKDEHNVIQGLISLEDNKDHIFVNLIENASFNRGKDKMYEGVAGNLFAFACKLSIDQGYEGYVAFLSKTALIDHYRKTLGAVIIKGNRMALNSVVAQVLVDRYFK